MNRRKKNFFVMAEVVAEFCKNDLIKLALVPMGPVVFALLKDKITLHHTKNEQLVMDKEYANLKQAKRDLLQTGAFETITQLLLYAGIENKPELKGEVDMCMSDLKKSTGDDLIDITNRVLRIATETGAALDPYRGASVTLAGLSTQIADYANLLSAPRLNIASRSALNKEMEQNIADIRILLTEKLDKAMYLIKSSDPEYYNNYIISRIIIDRHGARNEKPIEPGSPTGHIYGTITNPDSEELAEVIVQLEGVEEATTTDEAGEFFFDEVSPGTHKLTFIKEGYQNLEIKDVVVTAGEETEVDGVMELIKEVV